MNVHPIWTVQIRFTYLVKRDAFYTGNLLLAKALSYTISVEKASSA